MGPALLRPLSWPRDGQGLDSIPGTGGAPHGEKESDGSHIKKNNNFIYLFLALLDLGYTGYSLVVALGLLSTVASPATEHGL